MNENTNELNQVEEKIRKHINPEHDFIFWDQGFFTYPKNISSEIFCDILDTFLKENNFEFIGVEFEEEKNTEAI